MVDVGVEACAVCDEQAALGCGESAEGNGGKKLQRISRLVQLLHCGFSSSHFARTHVR